MRPSTSAQKSALELSEISGTASVAGNENANNNWLNEVPQTIYSKDPVMVQVYKDPVTMNDRVLITVAMVGGCQDIQYLVKPDRVTVVLSYTWPNALTDTDLLFSKSLQDGIDKNHPAVMAVKTNYENYRCNVDAKPRCVMEITSPIEVITDSATWKKRTVRTPDGGQVIMLTLQGLQNLYTLKKSDCTISFEDD